MNTANRKNDHRMLFLKMTSCYKNKILANEISKLFIIARFICTIKSNIYNGSEVKLTPNGWPKKRMTPLTFVI